jgi:D-threo-aldose 1-dehydrogenase
VIAAELIELPGTSVQVTRLGLGTAPLGGLFNPVPAEAARRTVTRAHDRGIRFFDTAPLYGFGVAESRLGNVLQQLPRASLTVSTKVGRLLRVVQGDLGASSTDVEVDETQILDGEPIFKDIGKERPVWDFSYDGVMRSIEESLERLQLDQIDIVLIHDPEEHMEMAINEAAPALRKLRDERVVGAIGVGLDFPWVGVRFLEETTVDCLLVAGRYTLLDRSAERELLPLCAANGVSVIAASVFNSGILADPSRNESYMYKPADIAVRRKVEALGRICRNHGVPLQAAALQFPYRHEAVKSVVVGARSPREIDENVEMLEYSIPTDLWEEIDESHIADD